MQGSPCLLKPWSNRSPGDLAVALPEASPGNSAAALQTAHGAAAAWAGAPLEERCERLKEAQRALDQARDRLARGVAAETGKPVSEARVEAAGLVATIDSAIAEAREWLAERLATESALTAITRRLARGPAAIAGAFSDPLGFAHSAAVAHLLAGNPVLFKPSPLAAAVAADYGAVMASALPAGVLQIVQGGDETAERLFTHPATRAICFAGSRAAAVALSQKLAGDFSKSLLLEFGGINSLLVCADANLEKAAMAAAEGACLTTGQRRCSTHRIIVEKPIARDFLRLFLAALTAFRPSDPLLPSTRLGPLIDAAAVTRYEARLAELKGDWLLPGKVMPVVDEKRGHYVLPAVIRLANGAAVEAEAALPIVGLQVAENPEQAIRLHNSQPWPLVTSLFTRSQNRFQEIGDLLEAACLYGNLPTTYAPARRAVGGSEGGRLVGSACREQIVRWTGFDL